MLLLNARPPARPPARLLYQCTQPCSVGPAAARPFCLLSHAKRPPGGEARILFALESGILSSTCLFLGPFSLSLSLPRSQPLPDMYLLDFYLFYFPGWLSNLLRLFVGSSGTSRETMNAAGVCERPSLAVLWRFVRSVPSKSRAVPPL